jgi:hypothetical protein
MTSSDRDVIEHQTDAAPGWVALQTVPQQDFTPSASKLAASANGNASNPLTRRYYSASGAESASRTRMASAASQLLTLVS